MNKANSKKHQIINWLRQHEHLMMPHQQIRFVKWVNHFELTNEFLQANFDRLTLKIKKIKSNQKPVQKPVEVKIILPTPKQETVVTYKKRRHIDTNT